MTQEYQKSDYDCDFEDGEASVDEADKDIREVEMNIDEVEDEVTDDEDDENSEEGSEDSEEDEEVEKKVLPERATRGKRYTQLLGEEEEKDVKFWGHDTWEEEEEDSGWSSEDEKVELEMLGGEDTSTDSEDDSQSDDGMEEEMEALAENDEDDDVIDGKKPKKPKRMFGGKYKDPSLFLKSAQKEMLKKARKKASGIKKTGIVKKSPAVLEPRTMSVRASTTQKKQDLQESIKRRNEEAQDRTNRKRLKRSSTSQEQAKTVMTQEERLEACKEIEKMNIESLNQLEAFEEHKKYLDNTSVSIRKQLQSGSLNIYISWSSYRLMESEKNNSDEILSNDEYCREMIIYTDGNIPQHLNQKKDSNTNLNIKKEDGNYPPMCSVYGVPAKYLDPLTNKYYSNLEAFKVIRRNYHASKYREVLPEIKEVQDLILETKKLIGEEAQDYHLNNSFVKAE
ncbi:Vps72/YL1 [Cryptosporidium meleagridis]